MILTRILPVLIALSVQVLSAAIPQTGPRSEEQIRSDLALGTGNNAALQAELGRVLLSKGRTDDASAAFEQALKLDPANPEAAYGLSAIAFRGNAYTRAEEYALLASGMRPLDPFYLTHLARVRIELKKYDLAAQSLERAIALKGQQTSWQYSLLAECRIAQGRYKDAAELTLKQLESRPWDDTIYVDAARLYYRAGDNASAGRYRRIAGHAWEEYDYLKGLQNENALAWSLFRSERFAEARDIFLRLGMREDGRAADLWAAGLCSLKLGQITAAEELFWSCIGKDRSFSRAWNGLANAALAREDYATAENYLREALRCDPSDSWSLNDLADLYARKEDWASALATSRLANAVEPDNSYLWSRTARFAVKADDSLTAWDAWYKAFLNSRNRKEKKLDLRKAVEAGYAACSAHPDQVKRIASLMIKLLPPESEDHAVYQKLLTSRD